MATSNQVENCLDQVIVQLHDTKIISTVENDFSTFFGRDICDSPMTYAADLEDFDEEDFTDTDSEEEEDAYDNVNYEITENDLDPFTSILNSKKFGMPTVAKDALARAKVYMETDNDADDERVSDDDDDQSGVSAVVTAHQDYNFESSQSD